MIWILVVLAMLFALPSQARVTVDWVTVGDPDNACEVQPQGCFGAVSDEYRISKFEVSNVEYAEFLNAIAATDTYTLYNTMMGSGVGGITRSGSSGSFSYSAIAGREYKPVNYVSFWDATRFANWLHNGQPTGAQGNSTTEDGAYTLTPNGIASNTVARNGGAKIFIASEDEWYKAAYYKGASAGYWNYPAGSDIWSICSTPGVTPNTANCSPAVGDLTDVGSYTGSASPSGTFDQGGNAWEWNEAIVTFWNRRGLRGGNFTGTQSRLAASFRINEDPSKEFFGVSFRVASAPVPVPSLSPVGLLILAACLLGFFGYRRPLGQRPEAY
jgi:formylglycine-generating enzyme required for sulfatase activity